MSAKEVGVGIIGTGRIGQLHTKLLNRYVEGVSIKSVCDVVEASARSCAENENIGNYSNNYADIFNRSVLTGALIPISQGYVKR